MSLNLVTVTVDAIVSPADGATAFAEGNFVFSPAGVLWPAAADSGPVVPRIQQGALTSGTASVQLVASDNFASGVLAWDMIVNIRGLPTINVASVLVLYSAGASQSIWNILSAFGYLPAQQA